MATTRSNAESDIVKDARKVQVHAVANLKGFVLAESDRTEKVITKAFVDILGNDIEILDGMVTTGTVVHIETSAATRKEEEARGAVFNLLDQFRKDVKATVKPLPAMSAAVGVGKKLSADSTPILLAISGTLSDWLAKEENHAEARRAGITTAKATTLKKARTSLQKADTEQDTKIGDRKSAIRTKNEVLKTVKKNVAQVRSSANAAFSKKPQILALFESTLPRHTPVKRKKKVTDPPK